MLDPIGSQVIDYVYAFTRIHIETDLLRESDPALPQSLNHLEATEWIGASLLGAWCHDEKGPTFVTFLPGILAVPWMIELLSWGAHSRTEWARGALLPFQMALSCLN